MSARAQLLVGNEVNDVLVVIWDALVGEGHVASETVIITGHSMCAIFTYMSQWCGLYSSPRQVVFGNRLRLMGLAGV